MISLKDLTKNNSLKIVELIKMTKTKSILTVEECKILEGYIIDMETIIANNGLRIPCDIDTIRCKTHLMAMSAGN